jgi:hypothetical protein
VVVSFLTTLTVLSLRADAVIACEKVAVTLVERATPVAMLSFVADEVPAAYAALEAIRLCQSGSSLRDGPLKLS